MDERPPPPRRPTGARPAAAPAGRRADHPPPRGARHARPREPGGPHGGVLLALGLLLIAGALAGWMVAGSSSSPSGRAAARVPGARPLSTTRAPSTTAPPTTTTTVPPTTTTTVDPGTLPQTETFPSASDPQFQSEMAGLWQGIVTGSVTPAMPAFFPESAYVQLKTIGDAQGDWQNRLAAAHSLLGSDPSAAQFVGVNVDDDYGHWIPPGVCDNGIGYFEMPNARIVWTLNGQTSSVGIASMISWRGEWYVVHFGAILRSGSGGEVDDPESGPGTPTPSSTC